MPKSNLKGTFFFPTSPIKLISLLYYKLVYFKSNSTFSSNLLISHQLLFFLKIYFSIFHSHKVAKEKASERILQVYPYIKELYFLQYGMSLNANSNHNLQTYSSKTYDQSPYPAEYVYPIHKNRNLKLKRNKSYL